MTLPLQLRGGGLHQALVGPDDEPGHPERRESLALLDRGQEDRGDLAVAQGRGDDAPAGLGHGRIADIGDAERLAEIGPADEQPVDAGRRGDLLHLRQPAGAFDLAHHDGGVAMADGLGRAELAVGGVARRVRQAAPATLEAGAGDDLARLGGAVDAWHHDPVGAHVERRHDEGRGAVGDADEQRQSAGASRHEHHVERGPVERRVLGVDHAEIEAGTAEKLGDDRMRGLDEGAGPEPAGARLLAQCAHDAAPTACEALIAYSGRQGVKTSRFSTGSSPTTTA